MPTINQLPSGYRRVQIRHKGLYASKTFRIKADAQRWATSQEDRGEGVIDKTKATDTIGDLIDLHMADMAEVGKAAQRSKEYTLTRLKETLGNLETSALTREYVVDFGRKRANGRHQLRRHRAPARSGRLQLSGSHRALRPSRIALLHLGHNAKSSERNRRPTQDERNRFIAGWAARVRQSERGVTPSGEMHTPSHRHTRMPVRLHPPVRTPARLDEFNSWPRFPRFPAALNQIGRRHPGLDRAPLPPFTGRSKWIGASESGHQGIAKTCGSLAVDGLRTNQ